MFEPLRNVFIRIATKEQAKLTQQHQEQALALHKNFYLEPHFLHRINPGL